MRPAAPHWTRFLGKLALAAVVTAGVPLVAAPARAQWSPVPEIPATQIFAVRTNGDTILAGADTSVFVSTDAGLSWHGSTRPAPNVALIGAPLMHNGRLFAGTFGQGVFVSDDLGSTWQSFNEGLTGGLFDSQLDVSGLEVLGSTLYASTEGAGVYARDLGGGGWSHFGDAFEPNQGSDVSALALGGTRLLAAAGANGTVFVRDPGDPDWTVSELGNTRLLPGFTPEAAIWTGAGWIVGTNEAVFFSALGQEPWTRVSLGLVGIQQTWFAVHGGSVFGVFDVAPTTAILESTDDGGATWNVLDVLPGTFFFEIAGVGDVLYGARADGLWRRSVSTTAVPPSAATPGFTLALLGSPVRDVARFRFALPSAENASLEAFDVLGRRVHASAATWGAGTHEWTWNVASLAPGVYDVRLTAGGASRSVRLVRIR